ncbi:relaxase MobL [Enterocloster sp. OA13]|nr:relaxase MobL [Enterocloster sp. OA13]
MNHGLFGKLAPGAVTSFEDWRDIARLVYQNSKKHITMYRSVISFDESTAEELLLTNQAAWRRYIDNHILTIAKKNGIRVEHLQWACALHKEKNHPHIHVVFWDNSPEATKIKNPFTPPAVPNAIRRQMIKDTFPDKIRAFGEEKNFAAAELRRLGDGLVDEFERHIRQLESKKYKRLREEYDSEDEISDTFDFGDKVLNETADRVFKIKAALPEHGRIAYQLLTPAVKKQVDALIQYLLKNAPPLQEQKEAYVQSKMKMTLLYGGNEDYLASMKDKFSTEADKIIANRILGMVKTLNRLDGEMRSAEYRHDRRQFYMENMLMEALSMLSGLTDTNNQQFEDELKTGGGLSKEAKKELYLKYQDKGYEH